MSKFNLTPYEIVKHRYITEKSSVLAGLTNATSNKSLARYDRSKVVFIVHKLSNKSAVREAVEQIYPGVKVDSVNMIQVKAKPTRRAVNAKGGRGRVSSFKKAIVTLKSGSQID